VVDNLHPLRLRWRKSRKLVAACACSMNGRDERPNAWRVISIAHKNGGESKLEKQMNRNESWMANRWTSRLAANARLTPTSLALFAAVSLALALGLSACENVQSYTQPSLVRVIDASYIAPAVNITVCLMTFAMGVTAGLGTLYMIAFNGLLIGVVGASCGTHGMSLSLWSFVVGHGSLEIPAIILAGAAGLRLGTGVLFPGHLTRRESIRLAGTEAVRLELGTIPLLIVAGIIEGFISPLGINPALKFALGSALFAALLAWILSGARVKSGSSASPPDTYSTQHQ